jgi:hypothetical protein
MRYEYDLDPLSQHGTNPGLLPKNPTSKVNHERRNVRVPSKVPTPERTKSVTGFTGGVGNSEARIRGTTPQTAHSTQRALRKSIACLKQSVEHC